LKLGLVVADFNSEVTAPMAERAQERAQALGVAISHLVHVPGVFDMPAVIAKLLDRAEVDALVLVGAVIKGDTLHDEVIMHAIAGTAAQMAGERGKPVALAITGPGMTDEQAAARIDYAARAVEAALKTFTVLRGLDAG